MCRVCCETQFGWSKLPTVYPRITLRVGLISSWIYFLYSWQVAWYPGPARKFSTGTRAQKYPKSTPLAQLQSHNINKRKLNNQSMPCYQIWVKIMLPFDTSITVKKKSPEKNTFTFKNPICQFMKMKILEFSRKACHEIEDPNILFQRISLWISKILWNFLTNSGQLPNCYFLSMHHMHVFFQAN